MSSHIQLVHGEDEALMSEITALSRRPTPATSTQTSCSCGSNREISQHHESRSDPLILTEVESEWSSSI
ncbi:hypothetical protein CPB83DRAFT_843204 [Crepidotus variabilis]|uniref:Uncharacterized protein n=1 Tax=Crepidotus variabilis TaxID=179855 RepID=A0A9P6EU87_9AGAR|nr:hypothetical protein CPB83DRAFT_843204 [Crepidotus variabilis]